MGWDKPPEWRPDGSGSGAVFEVLGWFWQRLGVSLYCMFNLRATLPVTLLASLVGTGAIAVTLWRGTSRGPFLDLHQPVPRWTMVVYLWYALHPFLAWMIPLSWEHWIVATPTDPLQFLGVGLWQAHLLAIIGLWFAVYYLYVGLGMGFWLWLRDWYREALIVAGSQVLRVPMAIVYRLMITIYLAAPWYFLLLICVNLYPRSLPQEVVLWLPTGMPLPVRLMPVLAHYAVHTRSDVFGFLWLSSGRLGLMMLAFILVAFTLPPVLFILSRWIRPHQSRTEAWWNDRDRLF